MPCDQPTRRPAPCLRWQAWACLVPLWLAACDARPPAPGVTGLPVKPAVAGAAPQLPATPPGPAGTSVPAAPSVFSGAAPALPGPAGASAPQARATSAMTAAEASTAMPMPGQANDHSVPVLPPKPTVTR